MTSLQHGHFEDFTNVKLLKIDNIKGNFVPDKLYSIIKNKRGKPDRLSIDILAEIIYRYRPDKSGKAKFLGNAWQTSYGYLQKKFNEGREQIRRSLVKLEQLGFTNRELKNTYVGERVCCNTLFIHLNISAMSNMLDDKGESNSLCANQFVVISPQIQGDYIDREVKREKSRSIVSDETQSNFLNKSFEEEKPNPDANHTQSVMEGEGGVTSSAQKTKPTPKTLSDFYPLSQKDCTELQKLSERDFDLNAMNEILLSMSKKEKLRDKKFMYKKGFLSYMSIALANEKRQAEKINNANFKINNNRTPEELIIETQEKYLEGIETSKDISPLSQFKKKLASAFDAEKAYKIITALKSTISTEGKYKIIFSSSLCLSDTEQNIIKTHMLSTHRISNNNITDSGNIERVEIITPHLNVEQDNIIRTAGSYNKADLFLQNKSEEIEAAPNNIWQKVREALIKLYGPDIDKSWFSKLNPEISPTARSLNLKAPSEFIRSWIEKDYYSSISNITRSFGFEFLGLKCAIT